MDEKLNLMLPVSMLQDNFNCSSYVRDGNTLVMEQGDKQMSMRAGEYSMEINECMKSLTHL